METREDPAVAAVARLRSVPSILRVISRTTGLRFAVVARVTDEVWKACAVADQIDFGLEVGGELTVETTLCREVRAASCAVVIDHASEDPLYRNHPTPQMYGFESYISVPIVLPSGEYFGNLCALDTRPAALRGSEAQTMFELYAELIARQLEADDEYRRTRAALSDAQQTAKLREEFIAVLAHDIRTPLSAIQLSAGTMAKLVSGPDAQKLLARMGNSVRRISRLVDELLDFARGRLGGGIRLELLDHDDLHVTLAQLLEEARAAHPGREVRFEGDCGRVRCDRDRVAQAIGNLVTNALQHSPREGAVSVTARRDPGALILEVHNSGPPIPQELRPRLFLPFAESAQGRPRKGLGLGLYIASQIAKSHGGHVEFESNDVQGTKFRFVLPTTPSAQER